MLAVRQISHVYRGRDGTPVPAVDGVSLTIGDGELVAFLGPSGCGKSTLLRILSGLIHPTGGTVSVAGARPADARSSHGIGWLAQDDGLLPWLTVAQNVGLAGKVGKRKAVLQPGAVEAMLVQVGLAESGRQYPHELSGGMRQRAALARALVSEPALLFLDEPFASLDELTRERLGDLLLDVRAARRPTTVLVTHSVVEAVRLADRVMVFSPRPARIVADVAIGEPRPRPYDSPTFGRLVQQLKDTLADR
ncbi:MAG: ABC transporter ATP-binding protein [Chloroflexi bacterium]|nr:ABC transporter ATP-binding protein [Chloroflexota bacterium]